MNYKQMTVELTKTKKKIIQNVINIQKDTADKIWSELVSIAPMDTGAYISSIQISDTKKEKDKISTKVYSDLMVGGKWADVPLACILEWGTGIKGAESNSQGHGYPYRLTPWVYYSERLNRFVTTDGMVARPHWEPTYNKYKIYYEKKMEEILK